MNQKLEWRDIKLVNYKEIYFEKIYDIYQEYNSRFLYTNDLTLQSKRKFWELLNKKIKNLYNDFFIIENKENNLTNGFIYSYDYNITNGYLYTAICIDEKFRNFAIGAEAGMLFLNYLFMKYPIRKVYCTVYEYNKPSLKMLKNAGFKVEGILKKHRYFDENYYNMYILSFYREDMQNLRERLKIN